MNEFLQKQYTFRLEILCESSHLPIMQAFNEKKSRTRNLHHYQGIG